MPSEPFRFFIFTCRDPESDFRLQLAEALRPHFETYYVWLRRRPIVRGPSNAEQATEMSLPVFLRWANNFEHDDKVNIYFNSTNTYFPAMTALLRGIMTSGVWCFDMHDDLRYHKTGLARLRDGLIASLMTRLAHVTVHAAPTLQELFPKSVQLGNASDIQPLAGADTAGDGVLIVASFDERFDYDFVAGLAAACPTTQFHLHGWTKPHATATIAEIEAITRRNENVHYHGAYTTDELPGILRRYRVTVAPYLTNVEITRYIDPLRFYHCLNAGLEVISTDIPQARFMSDHIHIVSSVTDCAETLSRIQAGQLARQTAYSPITWGHRAERLVRILCSLPRTINLQRNLRPAH